MAKTRREPVPQPHGGALIPGAGGGPQPGAGRPPKKFAAFMRSLRDDPNVQDAIEKAAKDTESRGFGAVLRQMTEYDEEKPKDEKKLSGELVIRVVRDE